MAEKKMTKAEEKRMEIEKKHSFIMDTFHIFMNSYLNVLGDDRNANKLAVTVSNNNHYLVVEEFGKVFKICIYTNGNVEVKMKLYGSVEYREQLFVYTSDVCAQAQFLGKLADCFADYIMLIALEKLFSYDLYVDAFKMNLTLKDLFADVYDVMKIMQDDK